MSSPPNILITPCSHRHGVEFNDVSLSLSQRYAEAIHAAGGMPWVMPMTVTPGRLQEYVRRCDGVLLTGGDDVQPGLYRARLSVAVRRTVHAEDPQRDLAELAVIESVFAERKPLLAICRGQQILNVAFGGTLVADIATQIPQALNHQRMDRKDALVHEIVVRESSRLAKILGSTRLKVNSSHHQAVDKVVRPLQATANSRDGVVESLELAPEDSRLLPFLLAVQFHPERLYVQYREFLGLFKQLIQAC